MSVILSGLRRLKWAGPAVLFAVSCGPSPAPPESAGEPVDLLVTAGVVLTLDADGTVHRPGYVAIRGNRLVSVGPVSDAAKYQPVRTIERPDAMVMPGLINGHQHAPMVLLRGIADDLKLMEWLQNYIFPAEARNVDAEFVYWGTRLAVMEMLQSGTTTFADMYYFLDEVARGAAELGMRAVPGQTVIGFPAPDHPTPEQTLEFTEGFIQRWKDHPLVTPAVAPHAPYTCSTEVLTASVELAEKYDVPVLIHLAETEDEVRQIRQEHGMRPVAYLQSIGFLRDRVTAAHGVWLEPDEIQVLKAAGVGVIHNPESNMKLASGVAPVVRMLQAELDLGLGTDGAASNNNLDMFEAMDFMAKLHKLAHRDPTVVGARRTLYAATMGSARALDMEADIGSLEAGKKADLILLDLNRPDAHPLYDPYSLAVYSLKGASVETVIIDGKPVVENRSVRGLDVEELMGRVAEYRDQVMASLEN